MSEATKIMGLDGKPHRSQEEVKAEEIFKENNARFNRIAESLKPVMESLHGRKFNEASQVVEQWLRDNLHSIQADVITYLLVSNLELSHAITRMGKLADENEQQKQKAWNMMVGQIQQFGMRLDKLDGGAIRL